MSRSGGMADAKDSKSFARKGVWVQVPPPALDLTSKKAALLHSSIPDTAINEDVLQRPTQCSRDMSMD